MDEKVRFGIHKKTGIDPKKGPKPTRGRLVQIVGNKELVIPGFENELFGLLNWKKQDLVRQGWDAKILKVRY